MKKNSVITLVGLLLAFSFNAYSAEDGGYMSVNIGAALTNNSDVEALGMSYEVGFDRGWIYGAAGGADFGDFRIESELVYQVNDIEDIDGDISSFTLLLNGYYDFMKGYVLRPYITAGIGLAIVEADIGISEDDIVPAYQVGVGISYDICKKAALDLRYRYSATSDPDFDGVEAEYSTYSILLGARYYF